MNVVHVFPYTARVSGGHANAIRSFIRCQRAVGINAIGLAPASNEGSMDLNKGFPLVEVPSLWNLRWRSLSSLAMISEAESIIHFHSVGRQIRPLQKDLCRQGIPYVLTSHGQLSFESTWRWLQKFIYLRFLDQGPWQAAGLHFLTFHENHRFRRLLPGYRGVQLVQSNLVDFDEGKAVTPAPRADYGIPQDAFVILFLGRLDVEMKGLDVLVEAFASLPGTKFHLVLIGPDWAGGRARLEKFSNNLRCGERVHFFGAVYGPKKWALLHMGNAFVSPSRREAFNISQAEGQAADLPVVTSDRVNLAAELRNAKAALVIPLKAPALAEAILELARNPQLVQTLRRNGRAFIEGHCTFSFASSRFLGFYQAIQQRRRTSNS